MGSGRSSGMACALATGLGVVLTSSISLFGAAFIFYKIPLIYKSLTIIGGCFLIYLAKRYIKKALSISEKLTSLQDVDTKAAFSQAFLVLISNPKMMTTYLALISLFPIVASSIKFAIFFSLMAGSASLTGHLFFATIFSTRIASEIYMKLYKPINAFVGIAFIIYAIKLFLSVV